MDDITLARAFHVLTVLHWIGGLAFVTLVVLPLSRMMPGAQGVALFETVEARFSGQVRWSVPLAGLTGLWMTLRMDLWARFQDPAFWWMHAMLALWAAFMLLLFVIEPLLHHRIAALALAAPVPVLRRISLLHRVLLTVTALTVFSAVAGAHGLFLF
ncbi:hypothetical protein GCM10007301_20650 [Azorhizobium oxalatiphilum]|uniref:Copper resistance protein D domain-containing protein n=1 Tax=Azorhizobium oxalatiphilum TaxID=980631 RepID=A0A917BYV2_9HYPH|nr:hypothetical protein [Azorhizobium oxalatiphilum]GGF60757.1 hypothetical protein GCM10007301_20650 [Azorhizobium oxalatiphilum]